MKAQTWNLPIVTSSFQENLKPKSPEQNPSVSSAKTTLITEKQRAVAKKL